MGLWEIKRNVLYLEKLPPRKFERRSYRPQLEWWAPWIQKTINRALLAQSSITMGKLKDHKYGNQPLDAGWDDDYLDDEYQYEKWKRKNKKKKTNLADDHEDFVDEY